MSLHTGLTCRPCMVYGRSQPLALLVMSSWVCVNFVHCPCHGDGIRAFHLHPLTTTACSCKCDPCSLPLRNPSTAQWWSCGFAIFWKRKRCPLCTEVWVCHGADLNAPTSLYLKYRAVTVACQWWQHWATWTSASPSKEVHENADRHYRARVHVQGRALAHLCSC